MRRPPRALVVAYYFPPVGGGGTNRSLLLVRRLAAAGWQPIVLTVDDAAWSRDASALERVPSCARVVRLPNPDWGRVARWARAGGATPARRGPGRLARWLVPDLHVGWSALAAWATAAFAASRAVDVVYTTCPPYSAHAAGLAGRALGVPWAADFRDGWTCDHSRVGLPEARRRLERRLEAWVLRRADRVFFASEAVHAHYRARVRGLDQRSELVLTGFDEDDFLPHASVTPPRHRLVLAHAGTLLLNRSRLLLSWLDALRRWQARDPGVPERVRIRLVGAEPEVAGMLQRAGVDAWVRAEPAVERRHLGRVLRQAHAALVLGADGPRGGQPVPGKLFDAVGAQRFVLAVTPPGSLARLVRDRRLGLVVDPGDPEAIVASLTALEARVRREGALPAPVPASRAALSAPVQLGRLVAHLDELRLRGGWPCPSASVS